MRFKLILILGNLVNILCAQQPNLIPNPSFEDVNICSKYKEACCPEAWRSTTLKAFYYLNDKQSDHPKNKALDGHRFVSICMHNEKRAFDRGFIQTPLLCQLEKDKSYELSFYYKTPFNMLEEFGALFLDTLLIKKNNRHIQHYQADLNFQLKKLIPANTWILIRDTFIAQGNEKVLLIGNLNQDNKTKITTLEKRKKRRYDNTQSRTYYLFDQFSLRALESTDICNIKQQQKLIYADDVRHTIPLEKKGDITIEELKKEIQITGPEFLVIEEDSILISETFELPNILFETNSNQLLPIAYPSLRKLANYLLINRHYNIFITGHTDDVGSEKANQLLSEKRAKAVQDYLLNQGVSTNRITNEGKGEMLPIRSNASEEGRSQNRRVEFRLERG